MSTSQWDLSIGDRERHVTDMVMFAHEMLSVHRGICPHGALSDRTMPIERTHPFVRQHRELL